MSNNIINDVSKISDDKLKGCIFDLSIQRHAVEATSAILIAEWLRRAQGQSLKVEEGTFNTIDRYNLNSK